MRNVGLCAITHRRKKKSPQIKTIEHYVEANILNRAFGGKHINQVWIEDITYIPCKAGTLYLSMFIDIASKMPRGYVIANHMKANIVVTALKQGLNQIKYTERMIVHTDRGSQYRSDEFVHLISKNKLIHSMSRPGNPIDNAVMESFFKTLKTELIYPNKHQTKAHMKVLIEDYLFNYYPKERYHTSFGMTPYDYEFHYAHEIY